MAAGAREPHRNLEISFSDGNYADYPLPMTTVSMISFRSILPLCFRNVIASLMYKTSSERLPVMQIRTRNTCSSVQPRQSVSSMKGKGYFFFGGTFSSSNTAAQSRQTAKFPRKKSIRSAKHSRRGPSSACPQLCFLRLCCYTRIYGSQAD